MSERPVSKFPLPTAPLENKDLSNLFSESQDLDINALEPQLIDSNSQCKQISTLQSLRATSPSNTIAPPARDYNPYDFESFFFDQSLEGFNYHDTSNELDAQSTAYNAHEFSPKSSCGSISPLFDSSSTVYDSPNVDGGMSMCEFGELQESDYTQNDPILLTDLPDEMFDLERLLAEPPQKQPPQNPDVQFSLPPRPLPDHNPNVVPTRVPALWESPPVAQPLQMESHNAGPHYAESPVPARIQVVEGRVAKRTDSKVLERRARNTEAARKSRQKTKARISELEKIVQNLQSENEALKVTGTLQ